MVKKQFSIWCGEFDFAFEIKIPKYDIDTTVWISHEDEQKVREYKELLIRDGFELIKDTSCLIEKNRKLIEENIKNML